MQLSEENEFGNKVAEFNIISMVDLPKIIDSYLIPTLEILKEYNLFDAEYFEYESEVRDIENLKSIDDSKEFAITIHGKGEIVGEGQYLDPIYIECSKGMNSTYIDIVVTVTNFLEYDLSGRKQDFYEENISRFMLSLEKMKKKIFYNQDEWYIDLESTAYSIPNKDFTFIQNVRLEDGELEDSERVAGPIKYNQVLDGR